jgi:hypothetical protein
MEGDVEDPVHLLHAVHLEAKTSDGVGDRTSTIGLASLERESTLEVIVDSPLDIAVRPMLAQERPIMLARLGSFFKVINLLETTAKKSPKARGMSVSPRSTSHIQTCLRVSLDAEALCRRQLTKSL